MSFFRRCLLLLTFVFCFSLAFAQQQDTTGQGYAKGIVKDSNDNHLLRTASVAVYKVADSTLVSYRLTNNFGEFNFSTLPLSIPLEVVVSSPGYSYLKRNFTIPADSKNMDLKFFFLQKKAIELEEVVITSYRPPVQMNGDTLEFNAEAFKLDPNAVVEDLMRKLPGVTVWGDGKITVNGKKVENIFVEGKPFFGTNGNIANQNISKDAVDKIQVYNQRDDSRNPLDSILNVNIKLKAGKKSGYFGKVGVGYGSNKRYATDGMISEFSPRTQVSIVSAINNINKTPKDVNTLMTNSSFKGVGLNIEYQPDFSQQGSNRSRSAGFDFMHYFIPDEGYEKNNHLYANYFITNHLTEIDRRTQTIVDLGSENKLIQHREDFSKIKYTHQNLNLNYTLRNEKSIFYVNPSFGLSNDNYYQPSTNTSETSNQGLQSTNTSLNDQNTKNQNFTYRTGFENRIKHFKLDYTFILNENKSDRIYKIDFSSPVDPSQNEKFDRAYAPNIRNVNNWFGFKYDDLKPLIFGENKLYDIGIGLFNSIDIKTEKASNVVSDFDTVSHAHNLNSYLTNNSQYNTLDENLSIKFEKRFSKTLTSRYKKLTTTSAEFKNQIFSQKNISEKTFQNIQRTYNKLLPQIHLDLLNDQFGDHQITYELNYNTSVDYPSIYQLAPLVDSANIFYQYLGNPNLKPAYKNEVSFSISYISFQSKNILDNFKVYMMVGNKNNVFSDSIIYDRLGRATNYSINVNPNRYYKLSGEFQKAYKSKFNQLQITGNTSVFRAVQPGFINSIANRSSSTNSEHSLGLLYTVNDLFAIEAKEKLSTYSSKQTFNDDEFKSSVRKTIISVTSNIQKKINVSSNINFTKYTSSYSAVNRFIIWNASIVYRFLKGNQAELKLSALDLLHQNTGIINDGYYNSLTSGNVNVLKQYFMLNLAYFPRKFGKMTTKNN